MKIVCIGLNYHDHAKELNLPIPAAPMFFLKPETSLLDAKNPFVLPAFTKQPEYELELVLKITKQCKNITVSSARECFDTVSLGIDVTARDLQFEAMKKGLPWEIAKAFDNAAPVGKFLPLGNFKDIKNIEIRLEKNGKTVQKGNTSDLIFNFEEIISYVSKFITLQPGDIIFTGTPKGVGKMEKGDILTGYADNIKLLELKVL